MNLSTPFRKLLVANRGEIALRIMRSARALGLRTVAVYSSADAAARHVREADQAVCIGGPLPAESYLRIPALLEAAALSGADAVHPGYGFLAENAGFARACREAGLVFVGPSPEAIEAMGHKAGAKRLMQAAGVPCIPGYQGADQSAGRLATEAQRIGWPVMIKAVAGGGGRGMRLAASAQEFGALLQSARSEAQGAFGDSEVILERAVADARHVEIQVFADRHGHAVHLGERDCSVQRRHQKLIEEAPSPAVDAALRERMGAAALAAVQAVGYEGAGTLEFLLDAQRNFYFMEMNTRLQVEHPVTEAITGLDLVELQLCIAAGEPLPMTQAQVRFDGHAMEVRLCAEDAGRDFMPQSGTMALWQMPAQLRVEHALEDGGEIAPFYDSMIAKLVAHGRNRDEARLKLLAGLEDALALGVVTNQAFLGRCLAHPVFAAGDATTAFVGAHRQELLAIGPVDDDRAAALAAVLLLCARGVESGHPASRRGLAAAWPVLLRFDFGGQPRDARVLPAPPGRFGVRLGDANFEIELTALTAQSVRFICNGLAERAAHHRDGNCLWLHYRGRPVRVDDRTHAASARPGDAAGDGRLRASMSGRVVAVMVAVGDTVRVGQPVAMLEAMKMEHVHAAPATGRVSAVHVKAGDQVAAGQVVMQIAAEPAAGGA